MAHLKRLFLFAFFLNIMTGFYADAQDATGTVATSREELLRKERLEKAKQLKPFKLSGLEKRLLKFETKGFRESLGLRFGDFYFTHGGITTGSGIAATARYFKANLFDTPIDFSISAGRSFKQYQLYTLQVGNVLRKSPDLFLRSRDAGNQLFSKTKEREGNFFLYGEFAYRDFTEEDFYGLGTDSIEDNRTDYRLIGPSYEGIGAIRFGDTSGAFFRAGFLQPELRHGKDSLFPDTELIFGDQDAPGLSQQPDFFRVATQLFFDNRDVPGNPDVGGAYAVTFARYFDRDTDQFNFYRLAVDVRQFIPLWAEQRILAIHFFTSLDEEVDESLVPFYLMQTLGGSDSVRGYPDFRFRDKNQFFISTEYRWEPTPAVEFALFYDAGKVFADRSDFDFSNLKKGYGFGIRLKTERSVFLRFDVGRSEEGTTFYLKYAASF